MNKRIINPQALSLSGALGGMSVGKRIPQDVLFQYSAEDWVYIIQQASAVLYNISCSILAAAVYEKVKAANDAGVAISISDIYTKQLVGKISKYRRIVDEIDRLKVDKKYRKKVKIYYLGHRQAIEILTDANNIRALYSEINKARMKNKSVDHIRIDPAGLNGCTFSP